MYENESHILNDYEFLSTIRKKEEIYFGFGRILVTGTKLKETLRRKILNFFSVLKIKFQSIIRI